MNMEEIISNLKQIIKKVLPEIETVDMNVSISSEYGINSISIVKILVAAEDMFDISFSDYELSLSLYNSFTDLAQSIEKKLSIK